MEQRFYALNDEELVQIAGGRYVGPTFVYVVQEGDSLPFLARRFGTTVRVLADLNGLQDPKRPEPGTRLLIPQR